MKQLQSLVKVSVFIFSITSVLFAQDPVDRVSVPFSDPDRPGLIKANLINGSITVEGYDGEEVIVEASVRSRNYSRSEGRKSKGMNRIAISTTGLSVEEYNNEMRIQAGSHVRTVDFVLKVPFKTNLKLSTINSGHIRVENVEGELELNNTNGAITARDVSGSVVANTTNGKVEVEFKKITENKPMSFVSFNGKVDVTFPENLKADVKMKSEQGEIYSDFDIDIESRPRLQREDLRDSGGKLTVKVETSIFGTINGGGPEFHFSTYNGSIYIRKQQ